MENKEKSFAIRTFGRIHGKKLSIRQTWLVDNILPTLIPNSQSPVPKNRKVILEIGFGAGEHLVYLAETHPDALIVGAEPYMNGIASLLSRMTYQGAESREHRAKGNAISIIRPEYKNIRIWPDDVRKLLNNCSVLSALCSLQNINSCFAKIYILHPDPWPKARHEKRRLLSAEFMKDLADRLVPNGQIIISTDHADYFAWIIEQAAQISNLTHQIYDLPPEPGLDTRYKKKDMFGRNKTQYLVLTGR